jgi:hypothetical protein
MGPYAATLGIIGTVLGLIHTLHSLGGDPAKLGELIKRFQVVCKRRSARRRSTVALDYSTAA